jgi:RNA polymerase sigma factor (sigma-70 family)
MMSFTAISRLPAGVEAGVSKGALEQRFNQLLAENGPVIGRIASSYARSFSDRDDLLQEIATGIWQALPTFRGECPERTFVFRIAQNRAIAYSIRNYSRKANNEGFDLADPGPDPETILVREEAEQRLSRAVRALPISYREAVILMLEGLEYSEIAEIMGISESNVGARLTRARQMLRQLMESGR